MDLTEINQNSVLGPPAPPPVENAPVVSDEDYQSLVECQNKQLNLKLSGYEVLDAFVRVNEAITEREEQLVTLKEDLEKIKAAREQVAAELSTVSQEFMGLFTRLAEEAGFSDPSKVTIAPQSPHYITLIPEEPAA